jgi:RimJ/RimL family protein N-acetyltransferase
METLETERLLLRHFEARDADDIYRSVYSDPEVCKYYCGGQTHSRESMGDWIIYRAHQSRGNDFGLLRDRGEKARAGDWAVRVAGVCGGLAADGE